MKSAGEEAGWGWRIRRNDRQRTRRPRDTPDDGRKYNAAAGCHGGHIPRRTTTRTCFANNSGRAPVECESHDKTAKNWLYEANIMRRISRFPPARLNLRESINLAGFLRSFTLNRRRRASILNSARRPRGIYLGECSAVFCWCLLALELPR